MPKDDTARDKLSQDKFFANNYGKLKTHFRPGATDFLMSLLKVGPLIVITNSKTEKVQSKLATLKESNPTLPDIDVRGNAEKYTIIPEFPIDSIAIKLDCKPHLTRPVFTQRGRVLQSLKGEWHF